MRKIIVIIGALIITVTMIGQAPASFKYQAVLRDARGNIKSNSSVSHVISILQGSASGTVVYSETQNTITDGYGLINLEIGKGTATVGTMSGINWSTGTYFIKISVDGVEMGTSQLLSVPYALYASKAANGFSGSYLDLTNKPVLFDGAWSSLTGKPSFATVATSGSYNDLINKPTLFDGTWTSLSGKPAFKTVATTGSYNDLTDKPNLNISVSGDTLKIGDKKFLITGVKDITISDELLFVRDTITNSKSGIFKMCSDGSNITLINKTGNYTGQVVWSDDKSKILFNCNNSSTSKFELFLMNANGTGKVQITTDNPTYGNNWAIFRNSSKIWYSNAITGREEYVEINYDGTGRTVLTSFYLQGKSAEMIDINKTVTKLVYYKQGISAASTGEIYTSNMDFSGEVQITSNSIWDGCPSFSIDGSKILFCSAVPTNINNVFTMNTDGSNKIQLTSYSSSGTYTYQPVWSPDGLRIAYSYFNGTQWDIYVMNSDGTGKVNITNTPNYHERITDWK
jgi:hypothetical protein